MRIHDYESDRTLSNICLFLTPNEAQELARLLERLIKHPEQQHCHLDDEDFRHEITIAIYTPENLSQFDQRAKRLIVEDK